MDALINRYRNITVLLGVVMAQLVFLAYQVKTNQDVRLLRLWTVTAVTPAARALESGRGFVTGFVDNYIRLRDARVSNEKLERELSRLKLENQFLKSELATADRARALSAFQTRLPSRTLAARVIGTSASSNSKVVFVDRGSSAGVQKGMGVITADGIVGKVLSAYPTASMVLLISDSSFAAGVIGQKSRARGTVRGLGYTGCRIDYIPSEEKIEPGEWFYTSGDDRIFPSGIPVGVTRVVRPGQPFLEVLVEPAGLQGGLEEVLIVLEGVHQGIPESMPSGGPVYIGSSAPPATLHTPAGVAVPLPTAGGGATDADELKAQYRAIGEAQNHKFGEGLPGSRPPDFNLKPGTAAPGARPAAAAAAGGEAKPLAGAAASPKPPAPVGQRPPAANPQKPAAAPAGAAGSATAAATSTGAPPANAKPAPAPPRQP